MKLALQLLLALTLGLGLVADQTVLPAELLDPPALATIPSVTIKYYEVAPMQNESIMSAVLRRGPRDASGNARVAETTWRLEWDWPSDAHGRALLEQVEVKFSAQVLLPQISSLEGVPLNQKLQWRRYLHAVEQHEAGHVWHAYQARSKLQETMRAAALKDKSFSPLDLKELASTLIEKLHAADRNFDRMTVHGRTQGVWWPQQL